MEIIVTKGSAVSNAESFGMDLANELTNAINPPETKVLKIKK